MINPKELRIGNFISDDDGVLAKIIGFNTFPHSVRCDEEEGCMLLVDCYHANGAMRSGCETDSPECNPIPLTPEWLERMGYEKGTENAGNLICWRRGKLTIAKWAVDKWQAWIGTIDLYKSPQYVHELQNLTYSLTGEELTIKP
jgi:hypothetical protein